MSNYIRHLLRRSLGPSATLQPRLASRFESNASPARLTELAVETGAAASVAPAPLPSIPGLAAQSPEPRAETAKSDGPLPSMTAPPATSPPPVFASPISLAAPPIPPAASPAPVAPTPPVAPSVVPSTSTTHEIFSLPPASSSTLLIEHVTERIRESYPVPGNGISLSAANPASPVGAPAFTPASPAPRAPEATPASSSATAAVPIVAPAAAPIIRVTIGRVDIRAIHPPPVAPVRASAPVRPPLVSLETYLNQRDRK
jgi:hypothetical protein